MGKPKKSKRGAQQRSSKSKSSQGKPKMIRGPQPGGFGGGGGGAKVPAGGASAMMNNPFEIRVNKRKHDNLGIMARNEHGVPGISRSRAIEKRKSTLLPEYKVRNKTSMLLDKRIGEKKKGMPEEEKIIRRSAAEKARQFKKKSIFNLQDADELLTHRGKPLTDIDRYEDPRDASDSEDERLDADFVSDANFGGFMRIKKADEEQINDEDLDEFGQPKTQKQIIQELILASKKKKYEKAKEADENFEEITRLDEEFKSPDFRSLLLFGGGKVKTEGKKESAPASTTPSDKVDYDKVVKELHFEAKAGRASDRLKTDDEVANEEVEKLQQLEKQRLARMRMAESDGGFKHRSADDLDDGFSVEEIEDKTAKSKKSKADDSGNEDDDEGSGSEDEDAEEDEDSDSDESDKFSDIESDSEGEEEASTESPNKLEDDEKTEIDDLTKKPVANDFSEIPFTLAIPVKYRDFEKLLKTHGAHYRSKSADPKVSIETLNEILTRMVKYNKAADRPRLPQLFNYIMRYTLESAEVTKKLSKQVKEVCQVVLPHLHTLLVLNPAECVDTLEKGEIFDDFFPVKTLPLFKILYFDLCASLFSCTDFHHHVLSPAKATLSSLLSQYKVIDFPSLLKMFYIVKIMYKMSNEAKRYSPEVVNILSSVLQCFAGNPMKTKGFIIPNLRQAPTFLFIKDDENIKETQADKQVWNLLSDKLVPVEPTLARRLGILHLTLQTIQQFTDSYKTLPSSTEIFIPIKKLLLELKSQSKYSALTVNLIEETLTSIEKLKQKKEVLAIVGSTRPKPLRLYEPELEEGFDGVRKKKPAKLKKETEEATRLAMKVKKEMKHAVREIRKDNTFLAKLQLREQLEKDADRKRKVKEIMGSLADQEGEYQKCKRGKN